MSSSSTHSSISSRLDPTSIQSQFAALTKSRDSLRQELTQIEVERCRHEASTERLKQKCAALSSEHNALQESLGKHRMKKALLEKEKLRLSMLLQAERKELETIGDGIHDFVESCKQSKLSFCKQLQDVTFAMEDLIQQHQDRRWCALLRDEAAVSVLQNFADSKKNIETSGDYQRQEISSFQVNEEWVTAIKKLREFTELHADMMTELSAMRDLAKTTESGTDFEALEKAWMVGSNTPNDLDLFYGQDFDQTSNMSQ